MIWKAINTAIHDLTGEAPGVHRIVFPTGLKPTHNREFHVHAAVDRPVVLGSDQSSGTWRSCRERPIRGRRGRKHPDENVSQWTPVGPKTATTCLLRPTRRIKIHVNDAMQYWQ